MKSPNERKSFDPAVKFDASTHTYRHPDGTISSPRSDDDDGPAEETFSRRELAARLYRADRFILLSLDLLEFLDLQSAVMLSMLIRMSEKTKSEKRKSGWFWYRLNTTERELKFGKNTQSRILQKLLRKKIIKIERRGMPAKRWFWIDFERIETLYQRSIKRRRDTDFGKS